MIVNSPFKLKSFLIYFSKLVMSTYMTSSWSFVSSLVIVNLASSNQSNTVLIRNLILLDFSNKIRKLSKLEYLLKF